MSPDDYDSKLAHLDDFELPKQPFSKTVDLTDLRTAQLKAIDWLIQGLLPRGYVTLLGGHGGSGKSLLALTWAAHIAHGCGWAGFEVTKGRVLFASLEDGSELVRYRLGKIVQAFNFELGGNLNAFDGTDEGHALAHPRLQGGVRSVCKTQAMDRLLELSAGYDLVVIDNASDAYAGNENDRSEVRAFLKGMLGDMAARNNQAVLLLAHIDKQAARVGAAGNNYSGSTAWHNSSRSRLALVPSDDGAELHQEKLNLGARLDAPIELSWSSDGLLKPLSSDRVGHAARLERQITEDAAGLLELIGIAIRNDKKVTAAKAGPYTTYKQLSSYSEFREVFGEGKGKDRFWRALTQLKVEKRISEFEQRDSNRNSKTYFKVVDAGSSTDEDAAFGDEKSSETHVGNIPPTPPARTYARAGERVGKGGDGTYVEPPNLRSDCPACAGEGCRHC